MARVSVFGKIDGLTAIVRLAAIEGVATGIATPGDLFVQSGTVFGFSDEFIFELILLAGRGHFIVGTDVVIPVRCEGLVDLFFGGEVVGDRFEKFAHEVGDFAGESVFFDFFPDFGGGIGFDLAGVGILMSGIVLLDVGVVGTDGDIFLVWWIVVGVFVERMKGLARMRRIGCTDVDGREVE